MHNLENHKTIIFDLDNTLFDEFEYLNRAYRFIGTKISKANENILSQDVHTFLIDEFKLNGRKDLYQKLITKLNISNYPISNFLSDLRNVPIPENSIEMDNEFYNFIVNNINKYKFFIATNGNKIQQENKFRSVKIPFKNRFKIIYCDAFGSDKRKPHPFFINYISSNFHIRLNEMIFIGDSDVDCIAAEKGKIDFLRTEEFNNIIGKI